MTRLSPNLQAALLGGGVAFALIIGALGFQYLGGYPPCEMCHWQRWPHIAAAIIGFGGGLMILSGQLSTKLALWLGIFAAVAVAASGLIGVFHAGVEWGWWEGPTACTGLGFNPAALNDPNAFRVVRCDVAAWRLFGISMAGYNALISFGTAGLCGLLLRRGN
jgi:disulfide bond formation protein DsbB